MGKGWRWLLGVGVVLTLSALPAEAQVRIGVGINIGSPPVYVAPYYEPYYYPPVRVYRGRPYYRQVYTIVTTAITGGTRIAPGASTSVRSAMRGATTSATCATPVAIGVADT